MGPKFGREESLEVCLVQEHVTYAAMLDAMDYTAVGKVYARLDTLCLVQKTLAVFTSDNSGLSICEDSPNSNLPLRAGKDWLYEGGIRNPLVIRWPTVLKAGQTILTPVWSPDYFATIREVTGAATTSKVGGLSLFPLLEGKGDLHERALCRHYPHYSNQGGALGAAIRRGDWKLIHWFEGERKELYNLRDDLGEKDDLSAKDLERANSLLAELQAWQKDVGALMPAKNTAFEPSKPNGRIAGGLVRAGKK